MAGTISGSAGIIKSGNGLLKLNATDSYTGATTIAGGILQATIGTGIPTNSFLSLDGGVLQFNNTSSFTRSLGTSGATVQWGLGGGGFSAGSTALTVNIGNHSPADTLVWGNSSGDVGTKLLGPLTLNASTAASSLTFQNGIDLNGGARSLAANANTVYLSGAISDSGGGGSLTKTGTAALNFNGSAANTYSGATTILGGDVYLNRTLASGSTIPGDLYLGGNTQIFVNVQQNNQIAPTAKLNWIGTGAYQEFKLLGHNVTVAGLCSGIGGGSVIEDTWNDSGYGPATLTVNNSTDCSFNGLMRDTWSGSGTIALIKTGTGTQTLIGGSIIYSGGTTVSQGKLVLRDVTDTGFDARAVSVANGATLELDAVNSAFAFKGAISGGGALNVAGGNALTLSGSSGNSYSGATTISGGTVTLAKTSGYAIPGDFTLTNNGTFVVVQNANQFPATAKITFTAGTGNPHFEIYGNSVTVAGISGADANGGVIENTEGETGIANGTLIVNNSTDCTYSNYIRDNAGGGSGTLALVKNGTGTLTLTGSTCGGYTGG